MEDRANALLRRLRLRGVWLLIVPFYYFAQPTGLTVAAGLPLMVVGLISRGWAAGHIRKDVELATGGPYAHTRNPLYVGSFLIGIGVTIAGGQLVFVLIFCAFFAGLYPAQAKMEAEYLLGRYGEDYHRYATSVPRFLPRLRPDRMPMERSRFNRNRYLQNREWQATLGVVAGCGGLFLRMIWR